MNKSFFLSGHISHSIKQPWHTNTRATKLIKPVMIQQGSVLHSVNNHTHKTQTICGKNVSAKHKKTGGWERIARSYLNNCRLTTSPHPVHSSCQKLPLHPGSVHSYQEFDRCSCYIQVRSMWMISCQDLSEN